MLAMKHDFFPLFSPDDADLAALKWHKSFGYAVRNHMKGDVQTKIRAHRIVIERMVGRALVDGELCDHINGIRHDERRENLRVTTNAGNCQNRRTKLGALRGTSWSKKHNRWLAHVRANGRKIYAGSSKSREEAAAKAQALRLRLGFLSRDFSPVGTV